MKSCDERKTEFQNLMRKIVERLEPRLNTDVYGQSVEAMKEALWHIQIDIQEVLK